MFKAVSDASRITGTANWLQTFADPATNPTAEGNQPGGEGNEPKSYTEAELQELLKVERNKAAAQARRATEAEYKPKLEEAQQAVDAAKPFLENPTMYMTEFLAQNPTMIQVVADGVDRMMKGQMPTQAQIRAVGRAADDATDPRIVKKLETLEAEMKATRESVEEKAAFQTDLKAFAKEATTEGLEWDEDGFVKFVNDYADENDIGDDDPINPKLMFRLWKAEQKNERGPGRRAPKLPGGSAPPPSAPKVQPKNWEETSAAVEAMLRARD